MVQVQIQETTKGKHSLQKTWSLLQIHSTRWQMALSQILAVGRFGDPLGRRSKKVRDHSRV